MRPRISRCALAFGMLAGLHVADIAAETALGPDYLVGRWSLEGADRCNTVGAEHIELGADDTFKVDRGRQVDVIGFWELSGNRIDLHLVASPHRITAVLSDYPGRYGYDNLPVFAFDAQADSFEAVVPFGEEVRKRTVHRCR